MCNCYEEQTEPALDANRAHRPDRRRLLAKAAAAGTIIWAAPSIMRVAPAQAASSVALTGTSSLWKWSQASPLAADVCTTGPSGNANRGSVVFTLNCPALPVTIGATITVVSGPSLSGANARSVSMLQSNAAGTCLAQTVIGTYNSANNTAVTLTAIPIVAGATRFAIIMVETGGGGTDTYTTNRVALTC